MIKTSLIIIGAGPGGYETAVAAAREGVETLLVESGELGGTCLNEGCIPTKCFCRNAEVLDTVRDAAAYGVGTGGEITFAMRAARERKDEVVAQLKEGVRSLLKSPLITLVAGKARFTGPHTVRVGEEEYTAPHIIIATGSEAKRLPVPGADSGGVVTASEMLQLDTVPRRLCVVGGGVVGMEFASIFSSFGSEVTVVEYAKEILPALDRDLAKRLRTALKRRGIVFHTGAAVSGIQSSDSRLRVDFAVNGKEGSAEADLVLMAVGRAPRVEGLGLEAAGISCTPRGITVDRQLQTNVEGVYAIGDVNGLCPLAHAATAQGRSVLHRLLEKGESPNLEIIPSAVFTIPEMASVGLTEEAADRQQIHYAVRKSFYRANGKSLAMGATEGLVKVLVDDEAHIIGAHILGAHAADLIHELALAMHSGLTLSQLGTLVHAHPSLSEILPALTEGQ